MGLELEELCGSVIGAAIEVRKALGPSFLESDYENALALELAARGIHFERQLAVPILYRGSAVGLHRLDRWWLRRSSWSSRRSRLSRMSTSRWFAPTSGPLAVSTG
ncbi:MAG TPA: GxxExxY protein [Polyangia bacterium]